MAGRNPLLGRPRAPGVFLKHSRVVISLNKKNPNTSLGILGFCYGMWALTKTISEGDVAFKCAVGCHPTTVLEGAVYGGDEVAMLNKVNVPIRCLWAGNDSDSYINDGPAKTALVKAGGEVVEFNDMLHGWVSRGDTSDETVKAGVENSINLIMDWFETTM